ncbi:transcription elongation factor GreA [Empedobacter sp. UBA1574]|uniref:transcription elongation factor GreA n=1 Tax=Empedobacter sp. UBA1574 TaxID=1946429 RepID=UPI0025BFCF49|nr:transcription elongation factor GreA [Empedobacter sp. UBA1574]
MANIQYVTKEGLEKLREELHQLETFERPKISQQIADARDKGDLSENAEYDAAKEAQGMLEMQIAKLKEVVAYARVIDESKLDHSKVSILSKVKIKNTANGQELVYTLVPESEADLAKMRISVNTPIAKGLLGKSLGEVAEITLPNGMTLNFQILEISLD